MCVLVQEKAIAIRITRIVYAFRNCVWPKPMEGLDLFNPTISEESSDDSSLSDMDTEGGRSDSDFEVVTTRSKRKAGLTLHLSTHAGKGKLGAGAAAANEKMVDVVGDGDQKKRRDFEIEKVSCKGLNLFYFAASCVSRLLFVLPNSSRASR